MAGLTAGSTPDEELGMGVDSEMRGFGLFALALIGAPSEARSLPRSSYMDALGCYALATNLYSYHVYGPDASLRAGAEPYHLAGREFLKKAYGLGTRTGRTVEQVNRDATVAARGQISDILAAKRASHLSSYLADVDQKLEGCSSRWNVPLKRSSAD